MLQYLTLNQATKNAISTLAKQQNLSQNQLAAKVGYTNGYFSMLINGKAIMTEQARDKLIAAGISPETLTSHCPTCGQKISQKEAEKKA